MDYQIFEEISSNPPVATILKKLESMHGAVAPYDVMMKRFFNISQGKTEMVAPHATRLETTITSIQRDHPGQMTEATIQTSLRDHFYQD